MQINLFRPCLGQAELSAIKDVLDSGWIGYGPRCEGVERAWAFTVGAQFGVATNSCTSALMIALRLRHVGPGDEVLVPTVTFAATAEAVLAVGATPVFCDVDADTMLLDLDDARSRITSRTKAVIPVLYAGQPFDIGDTFHGLSVIYDCAHAAGGSFCANGKLCCWSFQAVKNLGCGDGGMITLDSKADQARAKTLAWHGIDRSTWNRSESKHYTWDYDVTEVGYKAQMNDITAAILSTQIHRMGELQQRRRHIAYRYAQRLKGIDIIGGDSSRMHLSSWHLFVIRVDDRDELAAYLAERGIATGVHYRPLHLHTAFRTDTALATAEREWKRLLSLPMHVGLTGDQVDYICETIRAFYADRHDAAGTIPGLELKPITRDDLEFARMARNLYRDSFCDSRMVSAEQQEKWFTELQQKPHVDFRIIWLRGVRVGTMSVTTHPDGSREIGNGTVLEQYRGMGIATAAEAMLSDPSVFCFGTYFPDNPAAAVVMHRAGFEPIPIRRETDTDAN